MRNWLILLLFAFFLSLFIVLWNKKSKSENLVFLAQHLTGNKIFYYKGGYGAITDKLYIKRGDNTNNIYDGENCLFRGKSKKYIQLIEIDCDPFNFIQVESLPKSRKINNKIYILFTSDFVYILDYSESTFGKYPRDILYGQ